MSYKNRPGGPAEWWKCLIYKAFLLSKTPKKGQIGTLGTFIFYFYFIF